MLLVKWWFNISFLFQIYICWNYYLKGRIVFSSFPSSILERQRIEKRNEVNPKKRRIMQWIRYHYWFFRNKVMRVRTSNIRAGFYSRLCLCLYSSSRSLSNMISPLSSICPRQAIDRHSGFKELQILIQSSKLCSRPFVLFSLFPHYYNSIKVRQGIRDREENTMKFVPFDLNCFQSMKETTVNKEQLRKHFCPWIECI